MGRQLAWVVLVWLCACNAPAAETPRTLLPVMRCDAGIGEPIVPLPGVSPRETPTPGQMTEEAAQAWVLLNKNRWPEAAAAFARVEDGSTGDDAGIRELAQYQRGIALFNDRRYTAALEVFLKIAADHNHNKWKETLLWLFRFLGPAMGEQALRGMAGYVAEAKDQIEHFRNPGQDTFVAELNLVLGKIAHRNRDFETAIELYGKVKVGGELQAAATECIAAARAQLTK